MLISQDIQLYWQLGLQLHFDDGSTKSGIIKDNDYLYVKFRRNNNTYIKAGRVVAVNPVMLDTQPVSFTGSLIMDFSGQFKASQVRLPAKDILDFRVVTKEQVDSLAPDYIVTEDMLNEDITPDPPAPPVEVEPTVGGIDKAGIDTAKVG